jgi:hypothetical protein
MSRSGVRLSLADYHALLRSYVSRVENSHSVPAGETIEKFPRALEVIITRGTR